MKKIKMNDVGKIMRASPQKGSINKLRALKFLPLEMNLEALLQAATEVVAALIKKFKVYNPLMGVTSLVVTLTTSRV